MRSASSSDRFQDAPARSPVPAKEEKTERGGACAHSRHFLNFLDEGALLVSRDQPRPGRPRLGSPRRTQRILRLVAEPKAWTIPRLYQRLGRPAMSLATFRRRVREVAGWQPPRLVAKGDPDREAVLASLYQRLTELPEDAVVLAEDETHLHLLSWVRATWIARVRANR